MFKFEVENVDAHALFFAPDFFVFTTVSFMFILENPMV